MCDQCIYTATREESTPAILNNYTDFEPRFYLLLTHKPHKKPDQNGPYDGGFIYLKVFLIFLTVFSDRNFRAENFFIAADFGLCYGHFRLVRRTGESQERVQKQTLLSSRLGVLSPVCNHATHHQPPHRSKFCFSGRQNVTLINVSDNYRQHFVGFSEENHEYRPQPFLSSRAVFT